MKKLLTQLLPACVLLTYAYMGIAAVNPITVTFLSGTTDFSASNAGNVYYLVAVNSGVIPPNTPLPLSLANANSSSSALVAQQITSGSLPSACGGVSLCDAKFPLSAGQSCCLAFALSSSTAGSYTLQPTVSTSPSAFSGQAASPQRITVTSAPTTVLLTTTLPSSNTLALSVQDGGLTGNPRAFTITNSSTTETAYNVAFLATSSPANPTITFNASPNTPCGDIAPLGTCIVTIIPTGATPTTTAYSTTPTPITLTIRGDNTNVLLPTINILTYGNIYEGGFVYSVDDTQGCPTPPITASNPCVGSIGGTVVSLVDQAGPYIGAPQSTSIIWSSNGAGSLPSDVSYDMIPGINEISTSGTLGSPTYSAFSTYFQFTYTNTVAPISSAFNQCNGSTDGFCNTNNILAFYNTWITNYSLTCDPSYGGGKCTATTGPTSLSDYAAGLCTATINGYSDWYLPATCQMDAVNVSVTCPAGTQSMVGSLTNLIGDQSAGTPSTSCSAYTAGIDCLAGIYWSSTEGSSSPQAHRVWVELFSSGGSYKGAGLKDNAYGVRCSRALLP